ncbi:MAG: hypothetical protein ABIH52_00435, partial [Candidatus Aenigmatarchaeota archaeon]
YVEVGTVDTFGSHDIYILNNMRELFQDTLDLSQNCDSGPWNAEESLRDLKDYLDQQVFIGGYTVDVGNPSSSLNCTDWPAATLDLKLRVLRGADTETEVIYHLVRN